MEGGLLTALRPWSMTAHNRRHYFQVVTTCFEITIPDTTKSEDMACLTAKREN